MALPKKSVAYDFYITLIDSADPTEFKVDPTIAEGDFKISKDGGAFTNLIILPVVAPSGGRVVKIQLSAAEMNADNISVQGVDVVGSEWQEVVYIFEDQTDVSGLIEELHKFKGYTQGKPATFRPGEILVDGERLVLTGDGEIETIVTRVDGEGSSDFNNDFGG